MEDPMIDWTFKQLVDSFAARKPTPGGGAAAAMTAAVGTALLLMVVRFARGKKANVDREADLEKAEGLLGDHLERLLPMAERDCQSFDRVSAAYALPKETDRDKEVRSKAIQEALVGAMVVPEETMCMVRDVFEAMSGVVTAIGKAIVSDMGSGAEHLRAAGECAFLNVRANAVYLGDRNRAESAVDRAREVRKEIMDHHEKILAAVQDALA